jgi:hypothetical protein
MSSQYGSSRSAVPHGMPNIYATRPGSVGTTYQSDIATWRTAAGKVQTMVAPDDRGRLENALDNMAMTQVHFLGRFIMLSAAHRRAGGQGVVQFARGVHDGEEYAIKFFTHREAFEQEYMLYSNPVLRSMMPAVTQIEANADNRIRSPSGWPLPPCIVIERGESLDKWAERIKPDFTTILQVLSHVANRLEKLHASGLVHRDLKPGNVLWRPQHLEWTLIDFGCAAEIGASPLCSSLFRHRAACSLDAMAAWRFQGP